MTQAIQAAYSALTAFGQKLNVTAHNIANINTPGFKRSEAVLESTNPIGVKLTVNQEESPGISKSSGEATDPGAELSNVSLDEEIVNLITTESAFRANLKTIQAESETLGNFLDRLG